MTRAGFGKVELSTSVMGAELMGYGSRVGGAVGVHDPLFARALVIEAAATRARIERECEIDAGIAAAVANACARLTPARIGAGWGSLAGHSLNRRRLEDPVDPAVFVLRVDDGDGDDGIAADPVTRVWARQFLLPGTSPLADPPGGHRRPRAGARHPFVVTHANGRRGYLPPADAFPEGGYEVDWARAMGHPESLQDDIRALAVGAVGR